MRTGKSRFTTAGMSTFAIASETPMSAVPTHRLTDGPGSERTIVPTVSSSSAHSTTRDRPYRRLRSCASGDTSAHVTSGTAVMSPRVAVAMPVSAPIWSSSGPTAVIVGRMFAATRHTAMTSATTDVFLFPVSTPMDTGL